ncbi:GTSE1 protein, partial [Podargus strigoides]|nr:GTSE1 protein [Podargus strigoides]
SGKEDEVFVGPLGHKEKCIAVNIEEKISAEEKSVPASHDEVMWSPLTGDKFVEIFKEAHLLALQIETAKKNEQAKISQSEECGNKIIEKFMEDSNSNLKIPMNQNIEQNPRAVRRETYCVQDSAACQLPPCFQKESDKRLSDDESLLTIEKLKPGKHTSISTKPDLNSMGSSEDLISDKSSVTSDVFDFSFSGSSSALDKKALPAQSKPGLKKMTQLKLPGVASGLARKTTSSSLSVSSTNTRLNSSLPISCIGKNGKSSTSSKASESGSKLSSNTNRLSFVRPTRVSSLQDANTEKSRNRARSTSTPKISSAVSLDKSSASATSSEAIGNGIQRLSSFPDLQKLCQQNKGGSATKGSLCPKPKARFLSVPTSQTKGPVKTEDITPNKSAPKATPSLGLSFCGTLGRALAVSTPVKSLEDGTFQNSLFPERSVSMTPASLKRSGLPASVCRISRLPAVSPKTGPRTAFSPHAASVHQRCGSCTEKTFTVCSKQTKDSKALVSSEDDISLPPLLPLALNFSPEETEVVENELKEAEVQNQLTEEKQTEALLVDIAVDKSLPHALECESRPLIDLFNTPEVKITPLKPILSGQVKLIDLSSPLITLSPDENKENLDSPLLKL